MSFLGLEGHHVFVTGAAGGIGGQAVKEFLSQGCKVTAHDLRPIPTPSPPNPDLFLVNGDISDEDSIKSCITAAYNHFGVINILVANAGITDESNSYPIWKIPVDLWEKTYRTNIRGTFLTIKSFLRCAEDHQAANGGKEIDNLAIVVTGSETGKFGQAGHTEYASGKSGLQYGLVRSVKNEIVRLNSRARINAVAPGWVDTPLIEGRLEDPKELWTEAQATVPLRKIAKPEDVARAMCFLASHRAAGHISGECLSVDGGMEGRVVWPMDEILGRKSASASEVTHAAKESASSIPISLRPAPKRRVQILLSVDFDAVSGWMGTGTNPSNTLSDYSSGFFAAQIGVPRLLKLFRKHKISDLVTWFIPGHSMESFPNETKMIVESGAEIACHGYAHEGAGQMTEEQETDVIKKCVDLATQLTGKKPTGWRAPLYQIREHTIKLLEEHGFVYDTSMTHHDSSPYWLPKLPPKALAPIDFSPENPASNWMHPLSIPTHSSLVEIPCNWYMEDMTPLQFFPHSPNSQGYVDSSVIEDMWKSRFDYLWNDEDVSDFVFPLVLHPDTSGMAHVIGMIDRVIAWLKSRGDEVQFVKFGDCAAEWKRKQNA